MLKLVSALVSLGVCCALVVQDRAQQIEAEKDSRLFFGRPHSCTTTSSTFTSGLCYKSRECTKLGGTAAGSCALGFGKCCYFLRTCGSYTVGSTNNFVSPATTTSLDCSLEVRLLGTDICQLRLDFTNFELAPPSADGACVDDYMTVTGTANDAAVPIFCGSNSGQHMYVDVDPALGNPSINIITAATATTDRSWNIQVKQIECNSADRAPDGCTQYYTATSDIVESFNYVRPTAAEIANDMTTVHLKNQRYRVCVGSTAGNCIQWSQNSAAQPYAFMMSDSASAIPSQFLGTAEASSPGATCEEDYVYIPNGGLNIGGNPYAGRYCSLGFPDVVSSEVQPFTLDVVTDNAEVLAGDSSNVGFSLRYRMADTC